jgi:hypothetical protein
MTNLGGRVKLQLEEEVRTLAVAVDHGGRREGKRRKDECFL